MKNLIFKGRIEKVSYTNDKWAKIKVKLENGESVKAVGNIINPIEGYDIEIDGEFENHPDYGVQIKVNKSEIAQSKDKAGIIAYLTSGFIKGIGPVTAEKLYNAYGNDILRIIEEEPEKLLEINGISKNKLESIVESYVNGNLISSLFKLLGGQVTYYQANKIIEKYGKDSIKTIKENPYTLIYDIHGFGFLKADNIARSAGFSDTSPERVGAAIAYILQNLADNEGHCFSNDEVLQRQGIELLNPIPKEIIDKYIRQHIKFSNHLFSCIENWDCEAENFATKWKLNDEDMELLNNWMEKSKKIISIFADVLLKEAEEERLILENDENNGIVRIYWKTYYNDECCTANIISKLIRKKSVKNIRPEIIEKHILTAEKEQGYDLGEEQKNAIRMGAKNSISIITGGPGRGKTTIIKTILDTWDDDATVILCAPTGRASQKMKESTGRNAETIHRTIMKDFPKNSLIVCDECSMLDISLAAKLLMWASKYENNIILVGDVDQLPSVGPGNFFRDLINSKVIPTVHLKKCYRNSGSIAINAERINNGMYFKSLKQDDAFTFLETEKELVPKVVLDKYKELREIYDEKDICILSPTKKSTSGTINLNNLIREAYNPYKASDPYISAHGFRLGDRVMQTKNNSKKATLKDGSIQLGVFNGDCGKIINVNTTNQTMDIEFDDGRIATFDKNEMETFVLSYAMTIHKSQGSEYSAVIVINNYQHYIMLKRNLLYTAETRAKNKVIIIGEEKAVNAAIRNTDYKERNTRLKQRIIAQVTGK